MLVALLGLFLSGLLFIWSVSEHQEAKDKLEEARKYERMNVLRANTLHDIAELAQYMDMNRRTMEACLDLPAEYIVIYDRIRARLDNLMAVNVTPKGRITCRGRHTDYGRYRRHD